MLGNIKAELLKKIYAIIICAIIITLITLIFSNEIILILLNPVKEINNDWHNKIIYEIIEDSFEANDTTHINIYSTYSCNESIDYIPSIELTFKINQMYSIVIIIICNVTLLCIIILITYEYWLTIIPSMYENERSTLRTLCATKILYVILSMLLTHNVWIYIYMNISLHSYNEYNYYEFDIDFDVNTYLYKYVLTNYLHLVVFNVNKKYSCILTIILMLTNNITYIEASYYILITYIITEVQQVVKTINNKLYHLNV